MNMYEKLINTVSGKRCAILGLGVSNLPLARLLLSFDGGVKLTVYDKKTPEELGDEAMALVDMVGGQVLDIMSEERELSEQEVIHIQSRKTGALINAACVTGSDVQDSLCRHWLPHIRLRELL